MTPDEIAFTNAFNRQRPILTGFAHCSDLNELHVVRDAFFFGLARDLCPEQYSTIASHVVMDEQVAATAHTSQGFQQLLVSARSQKAEWTALVDAVHEKATAVGSDIDGIWKTLEQGRMEWLRAVNAAHPIKQLLKEALHKDGAASSPGDVSDVMMVDLCTLYQHQRFIARCRQVGYHGGNARTTESAQRIPSGEMGSTEGRMETA